ncbi:C10 family peptidase [bacterium]|nr:C10 family peptidase [bacterium]
MSFLFRWTCLTTLFLSVFTLQYSNAASTEKTNIKNIAKGWLKTSPPYVRAEQAKKPFKAGEAVLEVTDEKGEEIVAYVVDLEPTGYVVVSPDDRMTPVIAYSTESRFMAEETEQNVLLHLLRADIPERMRALRDGAVPQDRIDRARGKRQALESAGSGQLRGLEKAGLSKLQYDVEFGPFLASTWGQGTHNNDFVHGLAVWNYYTPPYAEGSAGNYVCGCVATAMAQVMNYYEWPPTGTNSYSYTWDNGSDPAEVLSADFSAAAYDWANMLDSYQSGGTEIQRQAAGLLTSHCGIAVEMDYAASGSSASPKLIDQALQRFFRYSGEYLDSSATFLDKLYSNMEDSRSAILSIRRSGGGHSVVVDGVRHNTGEDKYFHINLGWRGYGYPASNPEGWYNLEEPIVTTGNTYYLIPNAIVDILPSPVMNELSETIISSDTTLSWDVSGFLNATSYDLQSVNFNDYSPNFTDYAENFNDWDVWKQWEINTSIKKSSPSSFCGWFIRLSGSDYVYSEFSSLTLKKAIYISNTSTINYYWATVWFDGLEARLEISLDGVEWETLKSYNTTDQVWIYESIPSSELAAYHNRSVMLRWSINEINAWDIGYVNGRFFFDDFSINNAYISEWTTYDNSITSESENVQFSESGHYAFRVRAEADGQWWNWSNFEAVTVNALEVHARVLIGGAYEAGGDTLRLDLNSGGHLPSESPYLEAPATCTAIPDSIADWVLVELRTDPAGPAVEQRSALLSRNGYLCNMSGTQGVLFDAEDGAYYLVIHHRNHLSVMSAEPQTLTR